MVFRVPSLLVTNSHRIGLGRRVIWIYRPHTAGAFRATAENYRNVLDTNNSVSRRRDALYPAFSRVFIYFPLKGTFARTNRTTSNRISVFDYPLERILQTASSSNLTSNDRKGESLSAACAESGLDSFFTTTIDGDFAGGMRRGDRKETEKRERRDRDVLPPPSLPSAPQFRRLEVREQDRER